MAAGAGTEVENAVGVGHDDVVVLDDEEGVPLGAEALHGGDEAVVVARMQADGGLVEDVEHAGEVGAELGGEADALGFAARECVG